MTLHDKFQEWFEQADFEDIIMIGLMMAITALVLLIIIGALIATILT
mgnify:FL=1